MLEHTYESTYCVHIILVKELANKGVELRISMTMVLNGDMSICLLLEAIKEEAGLFSVYVRTILRC